MHTMVGAGHTETEYGLGTSAVQDTIVCLQTGVGSWGLIQSALSQLHKLLVKSSAPIQFPGYSLKVLSGF